MRQLSKLLLVAICFLISARSSLAAVAFGVTPEWLSHQSSIIFEGTPEKITIYHLVGDRWITEARFAVARRLKGPVSEGDSITVRSIDWKDRTDQMGLTDAVTRKRRVLVMASIAEHTFPETDGHYIFVTHFWNRPVIYADEEAKYIYTETGAAVRAYPEILKRVEAQVTKESQLVHSYWRGQIVEKQLGAPDDSQAYRDLFSMSAVLIIVPEYKEP